MIEFIKKQIEDQILKNKEAFETIEKMFYKQDISTEEKISLFGKMRYYSGKIDALREIYNSIIIKEEIKGEI